MLTMAIGFFLFSGLVVACAIMGISAHVIIRKWGPPGKGTGGGSVLVIGWFLATFYQGFAMDLLQGLGYVNHYTRHGGVGIALLFVTITSIVATLIAVCARLKKTHGIECF